MVKMLSRKEHKIHIKKGKELKRLNLIYGVFGLIALENINLSEKQIEALRRTTKKYLKKIGKMWLMVKADRSVSKKPSEVRMGKGKGSHDHYVVVISKGIVLLELGGNNLTEKTARKVLKMVGDKLPIKTEFITYKT